MCMQDLWIARHTVSRFIGASNPQAYSPNPNRIALLLSYANTPTITDDRGLVWFHATLGSDVLSYTTSVSTQVPPGTDTGTIAAGSQYAKNWSQLITVFDYGDLVQRGGSVSIASSVMQLWELVADAALQQKLAELEKTEGWPFYGIRP